MIRYHSHKQLSLAEFDWPFQTAPDENNRWVEMSECMPWDALSEGYYQSLSVRQGRPAKDARLVTDAVIIKHKLCLSDAEALEAGLVALHRAGSDSVDSIKAAASQLDAILADLQKGLSPERLRGREMQLLREVLAGPAPAATIWTTSAPNRRLWQYRCWSSNSAIPISKISLIA